ncbi:TonB-dependent receptor domain-containing protein [Lentisalinibacter sediminis]|uniref:TonB-dependent receptor domain-containing protein n=1 Tax=Lentisalinibacter sediminis TaxID=2992237 RepID=UPI00386ACDF8
MTSNRDLKKIIKTFLVAGAVTGLAIPATAQEDDGIEAGELIEEVVVTGTRIQDTNVIAASPVTTIGAEEIALKQTPNIERVLRDLPITIPGDGENVNNGTAGQATLDLRGLGPERMLILINGKRLTPYDINGIVTTDVIPVNMLERVDIVTGGASAVYGSDAMSGAVNFVLRDDFQGVEIDVGYSDMNSSAEVNGGGEHTTWVNALFGINFDDDRGNITIGGGRTKRGAVLLGEREYGLFGVSSTTGSGLGSPPPEPDPACSGNTSFTTAHSSGVGSTTAIPGTLNLRSGNSYQFRDDGSLIQGECARFNFNPFNYYQTPQDRVNATTIASYEVSDDVELYAQAIFSSNESAFQIAPSGTFGQAFTIPVMNPFLNDAARQTIIGDLNAGASTFVTDTTTRINEIQGLPNPSQDDLDELAALQDALANDPLGFSQVGIQDINGDGVFDEEDAFTSTARRRTLELGPRTGIFDTDFFQYAIGARGNLPGDYDNWNFDVSYQRGVSDFVETRDGFTNLTNLAAGINTVDPDQCISATGVVTAAPCTPINVFGPVGSITDAQRESGYFIAIASDIRKSELEIVSAQIDGVIDQMRLPWADEGVALAFGVDFMSYSAFSSPDECLKLAPASCQGGAGGNRLPIAGEYNSDEFFVETILPLVQGRDFVESLSLELGFRYSDYDIQGSTESWKAGMSWEVTPGLRFRVMEQQAVRVPNIGELFSPVTTALDNATLDPCSIGNPNPPQPGTELFQRCVSTGMLPSQVGTVPDIISGQVNVFAGTDPNNLPEPEEARTTTVGLVWQPEFDFLNAATTISLDWYDIQINDYIDQPTGQESLDLCYVLGDPATCSGIVRIGGALGESGTGTPTFFTNFVEFAAEGIDLNITSNGYDIGRYGTLGFSWTAHRYLTNEFQTTAASPVVDCKGRYGTSCDPVPEFRSVFRTSWALDAFDGSLLWRHIGSMDAQPNEAPTLFQDFRSVDSQNYFDVTFGYTFRDNIRVSALVTNITDEDPPILGNNTGSTSFNSGNTFPSLYDTMGRTYTLGLKVSFE